MWPPLEWANCPCPVRMLLFMGKFSSVKMLQIARICTHVLKYPFFRDVNKGCSVVEWGRPQFSYEWAHIHCNGPWYSGSIKSVLQLCWKLPGEVKGGGGMGEAWLTYIPSASSIGIKLSHCTYQILLNAMLIAFLHSSVRAWVAAGGYQLEVCSWWTSRGKLHQMMRAFGQEISFDCVLSILTHQETKGHKCHVYYVILVFAYDNVSASLVCVMMHSLEVDRSEHVKCFSEIVIHPMCAADRVDWFHHINCDTHVAVVSALSVAIEMVNKFV